jgi:signal transduction histidine kinase
MARRKKPAESEPGAAFGASRDFLASGGEMGERVRTLDWSKTPLGPVEEWPQSLRSPVSMMLPSKAQIILFWGPELVVLYNDAYRTVFGAKHPQMLGQPGRVAWSEIWNTGANLQELLGGVVRTGEAFHARDMLFVLERYGFAEETYFDVSYDPVRDESGRVGGVFCIVTETTGRVVGERRLALLKDLAARNATARTPRDACVLAMETLAAHREDVPFALAYLAADLQSCTPGAQAALASAEANQVMELAIPGGRLVVGLNPRLPFDDPYTSFLGLVAGQLATAVVNAQAYEEERKRAEVLAELDRSKTAFFSNVSHEFRTPLTLMLGPLQDLLARELESAETREVLATVQRNGQRLLKLVNTLLDFARIEAGRAQASYAPTDLAVLTADLASNFRAACEKAGLALAVDCPPLAQPAYVDVEMWEKIVLNLLSNAFKYTHTGGIEIQLREAGDTLRLTVRDTGIGIPADGLPRVFDRFHRIEGAQGRSHEGSGIGLALVHELVRLHGGSIGVESEPGKGSAFSVEIPKGSDHLPPERIASRAETASAGRAEAYVTEAWTWLGGEPAAERVRRPARGARVLVADDNPDLREYARRLLAEYYDVETASDGRAALEAARALRPDLIVSDVMMPNLDGFGLIRELRADAALRDVPVLLLSARAGEEERLEGLSRGADDYLAKPFSARELLVRAGALLQSADVRRSALEALREADRRKDEFLATLSHELRNPLAPLRTGLHLLRAGGSVDKRVHGIMERQVDHLVRLVDDLLEMSRITRGAIELRRERVELSTVVRNAVDTSQPPIQEGGHRLDVSLPGETLWLEGDAVRLAQVLSNLLNNAAKYTPPRGRITLTARRDGEMAEVGVRDNGAGIEPEGIARIFEMFTRGVHADPQSQGGLGIGLTLSRRLVEMHGGAIEARSEGAGKGSQFIVRLPLAAQGGAAAAPRAPTVSFGPSTRILVVDDNRDAATSLGMLLETLGAQVRVVHDGHEALAIFGETDPTVVLLDIGMPGMDGYEVARTLRERYPERRPTLVALTGWGQEEDRQRVREAGFHHHLVKPAAIEDLHALLAGIERRGTGRP